ncbi:MAG: WYL domain-containing protein [Pseudomonadota bacterium]|nr:WYL domain-containing protein [Pseudomonadota bacterium]
MSENFLRKLIMLQHIPRFPAKISTSTLKQILANNGFEITQRTIQRDLKSLSGILPGLQVDEDKDIPGWSWSKETRLKDIPTMDSNMALTFQLVGRFLKDIFPPSVLNQLKPYFESSQKVLDAAENHGYIHWQEKVRILSRTQALIPAGIDEDVIMVIYEALFKGRQVRARYRTRSGDEVEYDLHPLGLVFRESVIYLVTTIWNYQDIRQLALHRFKKCELLDEDVATPDGFSLDGYIAAGGFDYSEEENKTITLKALFFYGAGHHLLETPLSEDQEISEPGEGQLLIKATVNDSAQIRWWLMGFGDNVEVLEPEELRGEFVETAENLLEIYQS